MNGSPTLEQLIAAGLCPAPESGTWEPTLYGATTAGTPTYVGQNAKYVKISNMVFIFIYQLGITSKGGMAGTILIGSLPFAPTYRSALNVGYVAGCSATIGGEITEGNFIGLNKQNADLTDSDIADSFALWGCSGSYLTA